MTEEMDKAIDAVVESLVRDSQQAQKDGCCLQPSWRGHLCQYHQGYEDGADRALRLTGEALP
jgi:phage tail tape-measure protein